MDTTTTSPDIVLNANDRCDNCGAQAYVQVFLLEGDLLFCAHHYKKSEEVLARKALRVHDESHKLEPKPYDPETDAS